MPELIQLPSIDFEASFFGTYQPMFGDTRDLDIEGSRKFWSDSPAKVYRYVVRSVKDRHYDEGYSNAANERLELLGSGRMNMEFWKGDKTVIVDDDFGSKCKSVLQ